MMQYIKTEADVKFRMINTASREEENFHDFCSETVSYPEGCVIEVLRKDGGRYIEYNGKLREFYVTVSGEELYIPSDIPRARMWIRSPGGVFYKVPLELPEQDGNVHVHLSCLNGAEHISDLLQGDPYFETVYHLKG